MAVAYSLGAALNACGICMPLPPARRWMLADRVSESRAFPSSTVQVKLDGVPATDSKGRYAHVRGIYIKGGATVTTVDDNVGISGYQARSLVEALFLQDVTGHQYWSALEGRTILDDHYFRFNRNLNWPYLHFGVQGMATFPPQPDITTQVGLGPDATPGDHVVDISIYAPLARPGGICGSPLEGLIPLAALQRANADALRFRLGSAFKGVTTGVSAVSGYVRDSEGNAGLDIWLDLVYLPALVIDAPWTLDEYTIDEQNGILAHPEQITEYAWARFFPEDAALSAGQTLVQNMDGFTLNIAGFTEVAGYSLDDMVMRELLWQTSDADSAWSRDNAAQYLPLLEDDGDPLALMLVGMAKRRDAAAAGPIQYQFNDIGTNDFTRIVHRTVQCQTKARGEALAAALRCDPCATTFVDHAGNACSEPVGTAPVIVSPRGTTYNQRSLTLG